jgi:hypothetical protein
VITHYGGSNPGFVLAGRNMRELERQESQLLKEVALAWLGILIVSLGAALICL